MASKTWKASLACSAAIVALTAATAVAAQQRTFDIPAESAIDSIPEFGRQAGVQITAPDDQLVGVRTPAIKGQRDARQALKELLGGTGLRVISDNGSVIVLHRGGEAARPPAESGAGAASQVSELLVTGTNIKGVKPITPVQTITGQEMVQGGFTRLDDALADLPSNFQGGVSEGSNPNSGFGDNSQYNGTFASGVNLRGLGGNATLVLLDGQRLPDTAHGFFTDISMFPLSMIARVEVLTNGATATYGADAVAGVVNIITKKDYSGVETGVKASSIANGKAPNWDAYILAGTDWSTGSALITYDYNSQYPLFAAKRSYAADAPSLAGNFALLPRTQTNSVFGSVNQSFGADINTTANAFYASRTFDANFSQPGFPNLDNAGNSSEYGVDLTARARLGDGWSADALASFSDGRDHTATTYGGPPAYVFDYDYKTYSVEGRLDGVLFELPGGAAKLAAGALYRHESFVQNPSGAAASPAAFVTDARDVFSAYAELALPIISENNQVLLVRSLRVDLAARFDHYSDIGSTTNPKYGLEWVPIDGLTLHATYGTSFRAPTLYNLAASDPQVGVFPSFNPATGATSYVLYESNQGLRTLRPETSKDIDIGATIRPPSVPGLSLEISYFDIDFTNKIELLGNYLNFGSAYTSAQLFGPYLNANPTLAQINAALASANHVYYWDANFNNIPPVPASQITAIAYLGFLNLASEHPKGLDAKLKYVVNSDAGQFTLSAAAQYFISYDTRFTPAAPVTQSMGMVGFPDRFRANVLVSWVKDEWSAYARINYAGTYVDQFDQSCGGNACPVSSWTTMDLGASWQISRGPSSLRGLRISADVVNLFNANPPHIGGGNFLPYDPTNASPLGRAFSIGVTKRW